MHMEDKPLGFGTESNTKLKKKTSKQLIRTWCFVITEILKYVQLK